MDGGLDGLDGEPVHHLDGRGHDARPDDGRNCSAGVVLVLEDREHGGDRLGYGLQAHGDLGRHGQRSLGPDEYAAKVVAGELVTAAANPRQGAVGEHDLHAHDVVGGDTVGQTVGAAGVLRHVAADGARLLAGGVRGVAQAIGRRRLGDVDVDDAGLHDGHALSRVYLQDSVEAGHRHEHATVDGDGAAAEAGARAAWHHGNTVAACDAHDLRGLRGAAGHRDDTRQCALHGAVVLVHQQLLRPRQHVASADRPLQLPDQAVHAPMPSHAGGSSAGSANAHSIAGRPCGGKECRGEAAEGATFGNRASAGV